MENDHLRLTVAFAEFSLNEATKLSYVMKLVLTLTNTLFEASAQRKQAAQISDPSERQKIVDLLDAQETEAAAHIALLTVQLRDILAIGETRREHLEASLAEIKKRGTP